MHFDMLPNYAEPCAVAWRLVWESLMDGVRETFAGLLSRSTDRSECYSQN